jgi:hypothetical protein
MEAEQKEQKSKGTFISSKALSEGVLIGLFTLGSYLAAFLYEVGSAVYWGIPRVLIDIPLV